MSGVPATTLGEDAISQMTLLDLTVETGLCPSKSRGRNDIESGAIYLNDVRNTDPGRKISSGDKLFNNYVVLRPDRPTGCRHSIIRAIKTIMKTLLQRVRSSLTFPVTES